MARRVPFRWFVTAAALLAAGAVARAETPLPTWAGLADERLENGLRVVLLPRDTPDHRVVLRLVIGAGTLHEPAEARGVAHLFQHALFDGSPRFPNGKARRFIRSLGGDPEDHDTASVAADHTAITLALPGPGEGPLITALAFFADTLAGPTFPEPSLAAQRRVITDERRRAQSGDQRAFAALLEGLAPGSRLADRLAPQPPDAIAAVTRDHLLAYHRAWGAPANATLIVVGAVDPADTLARIRAELGAVAPRPVPPAPPTGVGPTRGPGAVLATDPALTRFVAALIRLEPAEPPVADEAWFREGLIDQTARRLLERRLDARAFSGEAGFTAGWAYLGRAFGSVFAAQFALVADPPEARAALTDLLTERARLIRFGFTESELDLARRSLLADAQAVADRAGTLGALEVANLITDQVLAGEALVSPADNLALVRRLLPTVTADDAARRCAALFASDACLIVLEGPAGRDAPTRAEALALARRIEGLPVSAPDAPRLLDSLAETLTPPVPPTRVSIDPGPGVMSARLANGVVLHHKRLDDAGQLRLTVTFAGGEIDETGATRGLTRAAAACFDRPAGSGRDGLAVRDTMQVRGADIEARVAIDTITVEITVPPGEARLAFEIARLITTTPTLERAAFEQWRARALTRADRRATSARLTLDDAVARALSGGDPRLVSLAREQIESLTLDAARAWLARMIASGPIEVAVVGPLDRVAAVGLATEYLSGGPTRPDPTPTVWRDRRLPALATPPTTRVEPLPGADLAAVAVGFRGPDATDLDAVIALDLAARTLQPRIIRRLREREQLTGSVRVEHAPARALPGFGVFLVITTTDPADADRAADAIREELAAFAEVGPGGSDVALAQAQAVADVRRRADDLDHWSRRLAQASLRGRPLGTPDEDADRITGVTPDAVRRAVADRLTPDRALRVIVTPPRQP